MWKNNNYSPMTFSHQKSKQEVSVYLNLVHPLNLRIPKHHRLMRNSVKRTLNHSLSWTRSKQMLFTVSLALLDTLSFQKPITKVSTWITFQRIKENIRCSSKRRLIEEMVSGKRRREIMPKKPLGVTAQSWRLSLMALGVWKEDYSKTMQSWQLVRGTSCWAYSERQLTTRSGLRSQLFFIFTKKEFLSWSSSHCLVQMKNSHTQLIKSKQRKFSSYSIKSTDTQKG